MIRLRQIEFGPGREVYADADTGEGQFIRWVHIDGDEDPEICITCGDSVMYGYSCWQSGDSYCSEHTMIQEAEHEAVPC